MNISDDPFTQISQRILAAAAARSSTNPPRAEVRLLAVSKTRSAAEVSALAARGQRAFGENYVQEALTKQRELADPDIEWHLIGHLQSNKVREAAVAFDWVQTVDRIKLVGALALNRPKERRPLNVLIQVNIDGEASKSGCRPGEIGALAEAIAAQPRLALRGLMAIPTPDSDLCIRQAAFRALHSLFVELRGRHEQIDALSMGMSEDFELAIAEGATLVRIGTALFGTRSQ
jgi:pyridoxal phosphate enzyme (YggS family)